MSLSFYFYGQKLSGTGQDDWFPGVSERDVLNEVSNLRWRMDASTTVNTHDHNKKRHTMRGKKAGCTSLSIVTINYKGWYFFFHLFWTGKYMFIHFIYFKMISVSFIFIFFWRRTPKILNFLIKMGYIYTFKKYKIEESPTPFSK